MKKAFMAFISSLTLMSNAHTADIPTLIMQKVASKFTGVNATDAAQKDEITNNYTLFCKKRAKEMNFQAVACGTLPFLASLASLNRLNLIQLKIARSSLVSRAALYSINSLTTIYSFWHVARVGYAYTALKTNNLACVKLDEWVADGCPTEESSHAISDTAV